VNLKSSNSQKLFDKNNKMRCIKGMP
jgi:hypothetical protein